MSVIQERDMTSAKLWIWCCRRTNQFYSLVSSIRAADKYFSSSARPSFSNKDNQHNPISLSKPSSRESMEMKDQETQDKCFLIVGLGNHGYPNTRHSVGMRVVDRLASKLGISWETDAKKYGGSICFACVKHGETETELILLKPKALMNVNGVSVAKTAKLLSVVSSNIFLIHDELDRAVGKFHLKDGGSAGGHNGVLSCMNSLRSDEMPRLRIGISRPASKSMVVPYVLGSFSKDDLDTVDVVIDQAIDAMEQYIARKVLGGEANTDRMQTDCSTSFGKKAQQRERLKGVKIKGVQLSESDLHPRRDFHTVACIEQAQILQKLLHQTTDGCAHPDSRLSDGSQHRESTMVGSNALGEESCQDIETLEQDEGIVER